METRKRRFQKIPLSRAFSVTVSLDACKRKPYPQRKSCGYGYVSCMRIRIRVDGASAFLISLLASTKKFKCAKSCGETVANTAQHSFRDSDMKEILLSLSHRQRIARTILFSRLFGHHQLKIRTNQRTGSVFHPYFSFLAYFFVKSKFQLRAGG